MNIDNLKEAILRGPLTRNLSESDLNSFAALVCEYAPKAIAEVIDSPLTLYTFLQARALIANMFAVSDFHRVWREKRGRSARQFSDADFQSQTEYLKEAAEEASRAANMARSFGEASDAPLISAARTVLRKLIDDKLPPGSVTIGKLFELRPHLFYTE